MRNKLPRIAIITDSNIWRLYGRTLSRQFKSDGLDVSHFVIPPGERSKTREMKARVEDQMVSARLGRDTVIIALGGGMVGDLAGFIAATYMRGIPYIQMPTTLVAQTDSSIGGKVGVDTAVGKNMIGAFYPPAAILIDPTFLRTLPKKEIRQGLVEMIKHGLIADALLARTIAKCARILLQPRHPRFIPTLRPLLQRSIRIKLRHVDGDERDTRGRRALLNYGHTFGHAIERASGFRIPHGDAVAMGMSFAARMAVAMGHLSPVDAIKQEKILRSIGAPVTFPKNISRALFLTAMEVDKKTAAGKQHYILLRRLGEAFRISS